MKPSIFFILLLISICGATGIDSSNAHDKLLTTITVQNNTKYPGHWSFVPIACVPFPYVLNSPDLSQGEIIHRKNIGLGWYNKDSVCISIITWKADDTTYHYLIFKQSKK